MKPNGATELSGSTEEDFAMYATGTKIDLVMCGHCEKKITPNLIASFGADHHDPDETMCDDCFANACGAAEAMAYSLKEEMV